MSIAIAAPMTAAPTRTQTTNEANQAATLRTIVAVYGRGCAEPGHRRCVLGRCTGPDQVRRCVSHPLSTVCSVTAHEPQLVVASPGAGAHEALWRLVADAQRDDSLAPVSVVVPSTV